MITRGHLCALGATAALTGVLAAARPDLFAVPPALWGGALAVANGLAAGILNRPTADPDDPRGWMRAAGGHAVRLVLLVGLLGAALRAAPRDATGLVIPFMIGYVCFLAAEIAALQRRGRNRVPG